MKHHRLYLVLIGVLLTLLLWIAWPGGQEPDGSPPDAQTHANGKRPRFNAAENGETDRRKRIRNIPQKHSNPIDEAGLERVHSILASRTLDNQEKARELLLIAQDKRLSKVVRTEAFEHGVLLDLPLFAGMAADTQIPLDMAETLLMYVIRENRDKAIQIRAYKDFLNYPSREIHDEAMEMLAFVLGDRFEEKDEASLLRMADDTLKELDRLKQLEK